MTWTYSLLMLAAVATGLLVSWRTRQPLGVTTGQRLAMIFGAFCGGMIGAKLPFVLLDWDGFLSGSAWLESGKTLTFGLPGGYVGVELAKWVMDVRVRVGDSFAAPVAAAIAVGRLACFSAGCCFGSATDLPWGVDFGDGVRRHPAQLYEFAFHLSCAAGLAALHRRGLFHRQLMKLYVLAYLVFRFATEFLRPEPIVWLDLTICQWTALAWMPVFVWLWIREERFSAEPQREEKRLGGA